jgi:hypothetical protein
MFVPSDAYDLMAYCWPQWVSDYTYRGLIDRIAVVNNRPQASALRLGVSPPPLPEVVWRSAWFDGTAARWAVPIRAASLPDLERVPLVILSATGAPLATAHGYEIAVEDSTRSLVLIPPPEPSWSGVMIDGKATLLFKDDTR